LGGLALFTGEDIMRILYSVSIREEISGKIVPNSKYKYKIVRIKATIKLTVQYLLIASCIRALEKIRYPQMKKIKYGSISQPPANLVE
jgi:hypothetical protein